ncbi:hypothetical protein QBC35DRAFT_459762 [Podospora australis]|uniref:Uncharacterized protein n=1 Tax=Podospora australis TaxID=1536484 RepID=A0AAN6X1A2_9PEZI|nr:hypothetical protein QBC35DRAFT_459762 [Podospora australis]
MYFRRILAVFAGLGSMAVGAPAPVEQETIPSAKGLKHTTKAQKRSLSFPQSAIDVLEGSPISQLARIAELQLASLLESQIALAVQLETIKNNVRINTFRTQFSQVNCVIITVTNVVDQRDPNNINNRYLLNQLRIDHGFPDKELLVMVTDAQTMTISATSATPPTSTIPTATLDFSQSTMTNSLDLGALGNFLQSTAAPSASFLNHRSSHQQPQRREVNIIGLDNGNGDAPFAIGGSPFGLFDQPLLLPFGTTAPTAGLVLQDPAVIIFPDQQGTFVETLDTFATDCLLSGATGGGIFNLFNEQDGQSLLYPSFEAALAAQLANLNLGGVLRTGGVLPLPIIPPSVLAANPELASELDEQQQEDPALTENLSGEEPTPTQTGDDTEETQATAVSESTQTGATAPDPTQGQGKGRHRGGRQRRAFLKA